MSQQVCKCGVTFVTTSLQKVWFRIVWRCAGEGVRSVYFVGNGLKSLQTSSYFSAFLRSVRHQHVWFPQERITSFRPFPKLLYQKEMAPYMNVLSSGILQILRQIRWYEVLPFKRSFAVRSISGSFNCDIVPRNGQSSDVRRLLVKWVELEGTCRPDIESCG